MAALKTAVRPPAVIVVDDDKHNEDGRWSSRSTSTSPEVLTPPLPRATRRGLDKSIISSSSSSSNKAPSSTITTTAGSPSLSTPSSSSSSSFSSAMRSFTSTSALFARTSRKDKPLHLSLSPPPAPPSGRPPSDDDDPLLLHPHTPRQTPSPDALLPTTSNLDHVAHSEPGPGSRRRRVSTSRSAPFVTVASPRPAAALEETPAVTASVAFALSPATDSSADLHKQGDVGESLPKQRRTWLRIPQDEEALSSLIDDALAATANEGSSLSASGPAVPLETTLLSLVKVPSNPKMLSSPPPSPSAAALPPPTEATNPSPPSPAASPQPLSPSAVPSPPAHTLASSDPSSSSANPALACASTAALAESTSFPGPSPVSPPHNAARSPSFYADSRSVSPPPSTDHSTPADRLTSPAPVSASLPFDREAEKSAMTDKCTLLALGVDLPELDSTMLVGGGGGGLNSTDDYGIGGGLMGGLMGWRNPAEHGASNGFYTTDSIMKEQRLLRDDAEDLFLVCLQNSSLEVLHGASNRSGPPSRPRPTHIPLFSDIPSFTSLMSDADGTLRPESSGSPAALAVDCSMMGSPNASWQTLHTSGDGHAPERHSSPRHAKRPRSAVSDVVPEWENGLATTVTTIIEDGAQSPLSLKGKERGIGEDEEKPDIKPSIAANSLMTAMDVDDSGEANSMTDRSVNSDHQQQTPADTSNGGSGVSGSAPRAGLSSQNDAQTPNDKRGSSGDPPQDSGCGGGSDPRTICLPPTRKGYAHVLEFHVGPGLYQFAIKDPNGRIWRAEKNGIPIPGLPPITVREGLGGFMLMNNVPDDEEDEDDEADAIVGAVAHASNGNGHAAAERERNSAGPGSSRSGGETERSSVAAEEESSAIAAPQQPPAPTPFSRGKFENRPQKKRRSLSTTDGSSAVRSTFGGGGAVSHPDRRQSSTRSGRLVTAPVLAESCSGSNSSTSEDEIQRRPSVSRSGRPTTILVKRESSSGSKPAKATASVPPINPQAQEGKKAQAIGCHQCRAEKNQLGKKECPLCGNLWCATCLRKRYGIEYIDVADDPDFACAKCQGHCNCSSCLKRIGYRGRMGFYVGVGTSLADHAAKTGVNVRMFLDAQVAAAGSHEAWVALSGSSPVGVFPILPSGDYVLPAPATDASTPKSASSAPTPSALKRQRALHPPVPKPQAPPPPPSSAVNTPEPRLKRQRQLHPPNSEPQPSRSSTTVTPVDGGRRRRVSERYEVQNAHGNGNGIGVGGGAPQQPPPTEDDVALGRGKRVRTETWKASLGRESSLGVGLPPIATPTTSKTAGSSKSNGNLKVKLPVPSTTRPTRNGGRAALSRASATKKQVSGMAAQEETGAVPDKQVDSDGETIDGYQSDDDDGLQHDRVSQLLHGHSLVETSPFSDIELDAYEDDELEQTAPQPDFQQLSLDRTDSPALRSNSIFVNGSPHPLGGNILMGAGSGISEVSVGRASATPGYLGGSYLDPEGVALSSPLDLPPNGRHLTVEINAPTFSPSIPAAPTLALTSSAISPLMPTDSLHSVSGDSHFASSPSKQLPGDDGGDESFSTHEYGMLVHESSARA